MSQLLRCLIVVLLSVCLCFAQESANKTPPSLSAQKPETELQKPKLRPNFQVGNPTASAQKPETDLQKPDLRPKFRPSVQVGHRSPLPPAFGPIRKIELSPEANSWAVQILSRGGITGTGRGDLTITSQGNLVWNGVENQCNAKLGDDVLQILIQTVLSSDFAEWGGTTAGFCADCYLTAIVLQRRESRGMESTYIAYWDDTSAARIPAELSKIYKMFMTYKGCKL